MQTNPSPARDGGHRVTVIGGGIAGARLAYQPRAAGAGCQVTVIGEETHAPCNRVLLAEVLAGRYAPEVVDDRLIGGILLGDLATVGNLARTWEEDEAIAPDSSPLHLLIHDGGSS